MIIEYQVEKIFREISTDSIPHDDIILIRQYSRNLKERLTRDILDKKNSSYVVIPWLKCKNSKHQMILTKDDFEKLHSDLIKNFRKPIDEVLSKSSLHYKDISMVISTGGSSRFYFVSEKLNEIFPDATILQSTNPQECIAKGLSLYIKKIRVIRKDHVKTIKQESVQNINAESDFYSDSYEQVKSTSNIRVSKNSQNTQLFLLGIWYSF